MPNALSLALHLLVVRNSAPYSRIAGEAASAICATSTTTTPMHRIAIVSVSRRNAQSLPYSNEVGGRLNDSVFSIIRCSIDFDFVDHPARFRDRFLGQRNIPELFAQRLPLLQLRRKAVFQNILQSRRDARIAVFLAAH